MKFVQRLLLLVCVAVSAYYIGQKSRPSHQLAPAESVAAPEIAVPPTVSPVVVPTLHKQKPVNPLSRTLAGIRAKLRLWLQSQTDDPDDDEGSAKLMKEMLAMLTDDNVAQIIQSLSVEELNTPFGSAALQRWMQVDPVTASNWLAARPGTTDEETLAVAKAWLENRSGLTEYLAQLPEGAWKQNLLKQASSQISIQDPEQAIKLAQQMKPGNDQTYLLQAVASGWASSDPNSALTWVAGVKDPALREQLVTSAVQAYALTDPAQAATWLVQEVKSDVLIKAAALNILNSWVTTDPAGAARWAAQFPEGDTKAAAVKIVASYWQQMDPEAATAWMQNLSGGMESTAN